MCVCVHVESIHHQSIYATKIWSLKLRSLTSAEEMCVFAELDRHVELGSVPTHAEGNERLSDDFNGHWIKAPGA